MLAGIWNWGHMEQFWGSFYLCNKASQAKTYIWQFFDVCEKKGG
jgi:hypothetical protein